MTIRDDLIEAVSSALSHSWDQRDGTVVPTTDTVLLKDGAVDLYATMLYADLADSTQMAINNPNMAARLFRAFLATCARLIRHNDGHVRSFDGDRIMGVFVGGSKNTSAVRCALNISWAFENIIKPSFQSRWKAARDGTFQLTYCAGVDVSKVRVVRAGIRASNDLVWVGRAPNVAAKLSTLRRDPHTTYVTEDVYRAMNPSLKLDSNGAPMWEQREWKALPTPDLQRSRWTMRP